MKTKTLILHFPSEMSPAEATNFARCFTDFCDSSMLSDKVYRFSAKRNYGIFSQKPESSDVVTWVISEHPEREKELDSKYGTSKYIDMEFRYVHYVSANQWDKECQNYFRLVAKNSFKSVHPNMAFVVLKRPGKPYEIVGTTSANTLMQLLSDSSLVDQWSNNG